MPNYRIYTLSEDGARPSLFLRTIKRLSRQFGKCWTATILMCGRERGVSPASNRSTTCPPQWTARKLDPKNKCLLQVLCFDLFAGGADKDELFRTHSKFWDRAKVLHGVAARAAH